MNGERGYVQIYCGTGKGKTTAALGLSLRILLSGGSVYFAQFFKGIETAEMNLSSWSDRFVLEQYGTGSFILGEPSADDRRLARLGFENCRRVMALDHFDLVVLDEILFSITQLLLSTEEIVAAIKARNPSVEVIVTGRKAPAALVEAADLVTDMHKVKHYFDTGVRARKGIEY